MGTRSRGSHQGHLGKAFIPFPWGKPRAMQWDTSSIYLFWRAPCQASRPNTEGSGCKAECHHQSHPSSRGCSSPPSIHLTFLMPPLTFHLPRKKSTPLVCGNSYCGQWYIGGSWALRLNGKVVGPSMGGRALSGATNTLYGMFATCLATDVEVSPVKWPIGSGLQLVHSGVHNQFFCFLSYWPAKSLRMLRSNWCLMQKSEHILFSMIVCVMMKK